MKTLVSILAIALFLSGCSAHLAIDTDSASGSITDAKNQVNLGDSRQDVLDILTPDYDLAMKVRYVKDAEKFFPDGSVVEIYYMKSVQSDDDQATEGEITPYMFVDDQLTGMGWDVVDGPKMEAPARKGSASND